jgi:NADH dehydrogenase [ubiquinone] 1 alpha subcomplex assembly factor 5
MPTLRRRLIDRLEDVKERDFTVCLDLGTPDDAVLPSVTREESLCGIGGGIGGVRKIVKLQSSRGMRDLSEGEKKGAGSIGPATSFTLEEGSEFDVPLPFPDNTFDCVVSSMALHWVSDLPGTLSEANRVLKPDGALFLAIPGGDTLTELRGSVLLAEQERDGGVSVRTGPYVSVPDVGRLLQGAGFNLPTVDVDEVRVEYPSMFVLTEHLGRMGEGNGSKVRREGNGVDKWLAAASVMGEMYKGEEGEGVTSSVQVIYGIGWKRHDSQQKPDERGKIGVGKIGEDVRVEESN